MLLTWYDTRRYGELYRRSKLARIAIVSTGIPRSSHKFQSRRTDRCRCYRGRKRSQTFTVSGEISKRDDVIQFPRRSRAPFRKGVLFQLLM